jgi:hypothetical protein
MQLLKHKLNLFTLTLKEGITLSSPELRYKFINRTKEM